MLFGDDAAQAHGFAGRIVMQVEATMPVPGSRSLPLMPQCVLHWCRGCAVEPLAGLPGVATGPVAAGRE